MYLVSLERHLKNIGCADTTSSLFLSFSVAEVSMARIQEKTAKAIWSYMVFAVSADTLARHCTQDRQKLAYIGTTREEVQLSVKLEPRNMNPHACQTQTVSSTFELYTKEEMENNPPKTQPRLTCLMGIPRMPSVSSPRERCLQPGSTDA